jgi:hypothetical protein
MAEEKTSEQDDVVTLKIMEPTEDNPNTQKNSKDKSKRVKKTKSTNSITRSNVKTGTQNKVLVLGIALCVIAVILFAASAILHFTNQGTTETLKRPYVSEARALFDVTDLHTPNFEKYTYISTEGLDNPTISDVVLGDIYYDGDGVSQAYCDAKATVVYRNAYVSATSNLKMKLAYDANDGTWHDDGVVVESQTVEPTGSANIDALKSTIIAQLGAREGEAGVAARLSDASIDTKSALSKNGGTIEFVLTKEETTEENKEVSSADITSSSASVSASDSSSDTSKTSSTATVTSSQTYEALVTTTSKLELSVTETLAWQSGEGWVAQITEVGELKEIVISKMATPLASSSTDSNQTPTKQLTCSSGDTVQITGTVSTSGSKIILDAGELIKVDLSGNSVNTRYFELESPPETLTSGQAYTVQGKINTTGDSQYPISITLS